MNLSKIKSLETKLQTIPKDKEGLRLWLRLVDCFQTVEQEIRTMLRENFNMTVPRFEVMSAINRVPAGLTMSELSRWMMVTKGNVTGIAERLSEDGYIERQPTPTDRRSFCVTLTRKGKQLVTRMQAAHEELLDELFSDFSDEDNDIILGVLARLKDSAQQQGSDK